MATITPDSDDETGWLRRVGAHAEYAGRIAEDFADAVNLSHLAESVLELGSAHGGYAAALCRRNPMLWATVIDNEPAVAIGRELTWEAGMERVITHRGGDIFSTDLGGPYDAVICYPLLSGLAPEAAMALIARARAATKPGGLLITFRSNRGEDCAPTPTVLSSELLMRVISRPDPFSPVELQSTLTAGGYGVARVHALAAAPSSRSTSPAPSEHSARSDA